MQFFDIDYVPLNSTIFCENYSSKGLVDFSEVSNQKSSPVKIQVDNPTVLGKHKSNPWDYEDESRIMCTVSLPEFKEWEYIDLRLKPEIFRNLKIILSPWDENELRGIVNKIIKQSNLPQEIKDSICLASNVRTGGLKTQQVRAMRSLF